MGRSAVLRYIFTMFTAGSIFAQTATVETRDREWSPRGGSPNGLAASIASEPSFPLPSAAERTQAAERFVNEKLTMWQKRLHLEDWRISVMIARKSGLKPGTLGATRWDKHKKNATIWVLDPADYTLPFADVLNDLELTLVHELVHLELASLPRSEASRSTEEHAVNRLAEALLALDKRQK